jgi:hypothetical protein
MTTTIEVGHFYIYPDEKSVPYGFSSEQVLGLRLAVALVQELGLSAQFLLFIDDYHGHLGLESEWTSEEIHAALLTETNVHTALAEFDKYGLTPVLISELEQTTAAAHLYHCLAQQGLLSKGKKNLANELGGTPVLTQNFESTCSLIDSALYLKKIGPSKQNATITVLPAQYKSQQEQVKQILSAYGLVNPPITVVYHDKTGEICEIDDWAGKAKV